jgi:hypothetical protein
MTSPADSSLARAPAGQPVTFGGVTAQFRVWHAGMPRAIQVRTQLFARVVRVTREDIGAERSRRDANVVDIAFTDPDPGVARAVVDATVRHFIALRTSLQRRESGQTVDSLRSVADQTRRELAAAESALEAMQRRSHLLEPEAQHRAVVDRYSSVDADLIRSRSELSILDRVLRGVDTARSPSGAWAELVAYPHFLENGTIGGVLTQLMQREQQRTELAARRTGENRDLVLLDRQIGLLDSTLRTLVHGYRSALAQQVAAGETELSTLDSAIGGAPAAAVELMRRERDVKVLSDAAVLTEGRLRQEELREALTFANVQVIDPPALRDKPIWPPIAVGLGVLGLLALLSAAAAMAVHERTDHAVRSLRDVQAVLGAPVLLVLDQSVEGAPLAAHDDVVALLQRAAPADRPAPHLALAGTRENGATSEAAAALVATGQFAMARSGGTNGTRTLLVGGAVDRFPAAAAVAASGGPVVLVVELGGTTRDAVARAAWLLQQTGATLVGAIAICPPGGARDLWE